MSGEVTALCVTQRNPEAFRLTVDSFRRHNPGIPVWAWLNDVDADTREFATQNCARVFTKSGPLGHHHAEPLDQMVREVRTPFVLTLDDDVFCHAPAVEAIVREMNAAGDLAFAASLPASENMGSVLHHERVMLYGQPRIDPCFALFRTALVARMTHRVSFAPFECCNLGKFYDTGGMLRHAAEGAGYHVLELPWLKSKITHWGALTWSSYAAEDSFTFKDYGNRIRRMRDAAKAFYGSLPCHKEFVVAKYNEDTVWVKDLPGKVIVYDKSVAPFAGSVALPNVGREAHTYAEHVARNYEALTDVVVFSQGNPFDHVPSFIDDVREPVAGFRAYGRHTLESFADGDPCHRGLPLAEFFRELTGRDMPEKVLFKPGAVFAATREVLHSYPKTWWRRLADKLAAPETQSWAPWTMERLWRELLIGARLPHRYDRIVGWFDFQDFYTQMVTEHGDGAHFVEVGAFHGKSSCYMATEIVNSAKQIRLDVVDTFRGSDDPTEKFMRDEAEAMGGTFRATFEKNVEHVRHVITVVEKDSLSAAADYPDESLDFVYLDAAHDEASVAADIAAWLPKIKPGGVLAGHDYHTAWPGVVIAVDAAFGKAHEIVCQQTWVWRKPQ